MTGGVIPQPSISQKREAVSQIYANTTPVKTSQPIKLDDLAQYIATSKGNGFKTEFEVIY